MLNTTTKSPLALDAGVTGSKLALPALALAAAASLFAFSAAVTLLLWQSERILPLVLLSSAVASLLGMFVFLYRQQNERMTRILQVAAVAENLRTQAERAVQEKSQMLATMSHEIRTPLNGVLGMLSLLAETGLSAHQRNFAETAQSSARTLLSIVDEVLDTAKSEISAGRGSKPVDVVALVESVTELLAPRAHAKAIAISSHVQIDVPREVHTDELRLRQVLFNLAGNAIKFTEKGGVAIDVSITDADTLEIKVRDTGIGMTTEESARVFEAYVQANTGTAAKFGGTGLGLAISRKLVEAAGGSIQLNSQAGKGTCFTVRLPVRTADLGSNEKSALANRHYVLAMPEGFAREHLAKTFVELGAEVSFAKSPRDLSRQLAKARPLVEFICSSTYFPTLRKWAKKAAISATGHAAVWVLLKAEERQDNIDLLRQPFAGYLLNPLRRSTLLTRLSDHDGKALKQTSQRLGKQRSKVSSTKKVTSALTILLAEDNAVNALLGRTILENAGHKVHVASDGQIAINSLQGNEVFDLALLDVEMPRFSGLEVARQIRSAPELTHRRQLPVLALTANARPEDLAECLAAGMDDHLAKPFDRLDLEDKIAVLVKKQRQNAA